MTSRPWDLDWSRHLLAPAEAELGDGVFLAKFARSLGSAIFEGWWGDEPSELKPPTFPGTEILDPDMAFEPDGSAIPSIHAAFGPAVRKVLSPAAWRDIDLRLTDHDAWLRSHLPDPDLDGQPISIERLRARQGRDAADPITEDNWQAAWEMVEMARSLREGAAERMVRIAAAIAELALTERIHLTARPILGGPCDTPVPRTIWLGGAESRLRRLASCGFDPAAPDDPSAEATHLIFVRDEGLVETVAQYGRANLICMFPPNEPWTIVDEDDGEAPPRRRIVHAPDLKADVLTYARTVMKTMGNELWRGPDLERVVAARFGLNMEGIVKSVRRQLAAEETGWGHLAVRGQPPKGERPAVMTEAEFEAFARNLPPRPTTRPSAR